MKRLALALILAGWPAGLLAEGLRFDSPTFESPRYAVRLTFSTKAGPVTLEEVRLNGTAFAAALFFQAGVLADRSKPLAAGSYDVVLPYAWAAKKKYAVSVAYRAKGSSRTRTADYTGVSPEQGGIPPGAVEGFHRVYRVTEEAGLARSGEIASLTLTALRPEVEDGLLRLYDGPAELPYQVLERRATGAAGSPSAGGPSAGGPSPPAMTYKLVFPLNAEAGDRKLLLVTRGQPAASGESGLTLTGEKLGKTIQSRRLVLQFHPQSGQILTIDYLKERLKLWNKEGPVHWNPDVFIPGIAWDHSFDWNPPEEFDEKLGEFVYVNARSGPLPHVKDARLEVRYTVEADSPYFLSETRLSVENDLGVIALRNDEMVLYKELFDTLMYRDNDGRIVTLPLKERAESPFGLAHIAPPNIPWAGLLNMKEGYGFFTVRIEAADAGLRAAGSFLHKAGTYFYAPSDGSYVYWVRPLLYTWGDYRTNDLLTFLPKGSTFYEKNAYVLLRLTGQTPRDLDTLLRKLKEPLRVF